MKMYYITYIYYLITVISFSFVLSTNPTTSLKCHGRRLGEICDYRRACLDANAKCVGQIKRDLLFEAKEQLFLFKCECRRYFDEEDGKCKFNPTVVIVPVVIIICIFVAIILSFVFRFAWREIPPVNEPLIAA